MDCMGALIQKMRGEDPSTPKEKINEGEPDEMVSHMILHIKHLTHNAITLLHKAG